LSLIVGACAAEMNLEVAQAEAEEVARAQITARSAAFADRFRRADVPTLMATDGPKRRSSGRTSPARVVSSLWNSPSIRC
jgi:hypothetical protein